MQSKIQFVSLSIQQITEIYNIILKGHICRQKLRNILTATLDTFKNLEPSCIKKLCLIQHKLTSKINMTVSHTNSVLHLAYTSVSTTTKCHIQLGPVVYYLPPKTWKLVFFRLIMHHNNRNKSINFIFMWNQANKNILKIRCSREFRYKRGW